MYAHFSNKNTRLFLFMMFTFCFEKKKCCKVEDTNKRKGRGESVIERGVGGGSKGG